MGVKFGIVEKEKRIPDGLAEDRIHANRRLVAKR